jgi:hypothetical protein
LALSKLPTLQWQHFHDLVPKRCFSPSRDRVFQNVGSVSQPGKAIDVKDVPQVFTVTGCTMALMSADDRSSEQ